MKKLFLSVLFVSLLIAAKADIIDKTYTFSNPKISQYGEFQQISFDKTILTAKAGEPALPYYAVSLLLPPGHIATEVEFIGEDIVYLEGIFNIFPYQPSRPLSETTEAEFVKNDFIYNSSEQYPKSQYAKLSSNFMNGHGFAFSSFTPIMYNPAEGKISYFSKVSIRIKTEPGEVAEKALLNLSSRIDVKKRLLSLAQNPEMIDNYQTKSIRSDEQYELLILTPEQFEADFDELRNIYLSRGIRSKLFTKEYIQANIEGQDLQEKIRNFIIQEYQESDVEYVLLGGDVEHIPYRGFYCYVVSGGGYSDSGIPADLYYSALDGNWNDNGDNKWGEPDEDDLLPDIAVARFPFSNTSELTNLINKSISYQNSPVLGEFRSPLLAGEHLYSDPETWGKDYLDLLIGEHDDNGYSTVGIPETYDYETMYEYDAVWSGSDLIDKVNQGIQFVHHVGHASPSFVAHLYTSDITDANFYAANGIDHNFTIMQTHGCDCGSFDNNDCILEKMVNIQNFAVAVVGNSRYGWFNEGQTEGPAAHLHREMADAMFYEKIAQIGKAFMESKIQTAPWVEAAGQHEEGALRWNFYDINVLGDPAMSIWNDEPIDIEVDYPAEVMLGAASIEVSISADGEAMEGFSCVVLKDGELCAISSTDENGDAIMTFDPIVTEIGEAYIIVSGYNCLPDTNEIMFIPAEGPYVVFAENIIDDGEGNGDGIIDCGEQILLDVSLKNVGVEIAIGIEAVLSEEENEWVSITDDSEIYGDIEASGTVMIQQAFAFNVADNIPDQTVLNFVIDADDGSQNWISAFQLLANAPVLVSGDIFVDDNSGNANGQIDPGETVTIELTVLNDGHSDCFDAIATLSSSNPYVTIENGSFSLGNINVGDEGIASFEVEVDEYTPIGTPLELNLEMTTGAYVFSQQYYLTIGIMMEDFETGDFTAFEWINAGNELWTIDSQEAYEGSYSAKSGNISDDQYSDLMISMETMGEGEISFYCKVSSEESWDFLKFYMDGDKLGEWSGDADWQQFTYPVSAGSHILKWTYDKDQNTSNGSDCAWLDNIVFPATTMIIGVEDVVQAKNHKVYPNPSEGVFFVSSDLLENEAKVKVYDISGRLMLVQDISVNSGALKIDLNNPEKGMYIIEIRSETGYSFEKLIVR